MITKRVFWILALTFMLGVAANAGTILVTGTGLWNQTTPATRYTAPGASWDFSFLIPDTIDVVSSGIDFTTTQATSFNYSLGGSPVIASLTSVSFYSLADGGLFDLFLSDGTGFGGFGGQVYSGTSTPLTLLPGVYAASVYTYPNDQTIGTGTVTLAAQAAPEPATWLLFAPALGLLVLRRRR